MKVFEPKTLQGFDSAQFNDQMYKAIHLQAWIEGGDINCHSHLLKASSSIGASFKTFTIVQNWARSYWV